MAGERGRRRAQWMARVQDGDQDAYRALLDDIGPVVRGFLRRRVAASDEVEDILQETLIALHRARRTYEPGRPLEPWLFAIARNVAADYNRKHLARLSWEVLVATPPERPADAEGSAEQQLAEVLAQLPPTQREAFEMLKLEGRSVEAGALRAGTTPGALKVRAHRAYKAIKALLGG